MGPRLRPNLISSELPDGETVIATPDRSRAVILNAMGAVVVDLCDGSRSVDAIATFICKHVKVATSDSVANDVEKILSELRSAELLEDS